MKQKLLLLAAIGGLVIATATGVITVAQALEFTREIVRIFAAAVEIAQVS